MSETNLIHKADIYFDLLESIDENDGSENINPNQMHHGEVRIYLDQIYLLAGNSIYKTKVSDIQKIQTDIAKRQIRITSWEHTIVLTCGKFSKLLALRDFLNFSQNNFLSKRIMAIGFQTAQNNQAVSVVKKHRNTYRELKSNNN
jgi:hypothetical protein